VRASVYCCVASQLFIVALLHWFIVEFCSNPRDKNMHPTIPRDAEEPNSESSPKVRIVDRRNQPDWISSIQHANDVTYLGIHWVSVASFCEMTSCGKKFL
jgi:hypothetical protein